MKKDKGKVTEREEKYKGSDVLLLKKLRVHENPFISSDEEDIPREVKKKDKGKATEREDKHEGSDTKKKSDESLVEVRRSPRKKLARYEDESDVLPVKILLK